MRFIAGGPNIPDLLLERRDQGRVVFFCGAGVSFNSGMPSFFDLTKHVIEFFDPPTSSAIAREFQPWNINSPGAKTPLDQIFHMLYQEYGRDDVNSLVADRLRVKNSKKKSLEHKIIAKLSADQEGNPQIVTTNFDRLFENVVDKKFRNIFEPPAFPEIKLGIKLTGITYLHGRLQDPSNKNHPYILSSADFGRAYLSEGWATTFVRALLENFTVVLVGYQAEDPPVKYLLQGLNHNGLSDRSNLYAFDKGLPEKIEVKWRDRGVTAIAYEDHSHLWESLGAWADRADDPRRWRANVVKLALKGPQNLTAHERGQVVHLVRTTPGAKLFSLSDPIPSPEWLCVFDAYLRTAKASKNYGDEKESFDPFNTYHLDDDEPPLYGAGWNYECIHDHILEWRHGDTNPPTFHRLSGRNHIGFEDIPPRLFYLTVWIAKNLDNPILAWWAVRQNGLHPRLIERIRIDLRRKNQINPNALRVWNLILEYNSDKRNFSAFDGWYVLKEMLQQEGWSFWVLRKFEEVFSPRVFISPPYGIAASKPPSDNWDEIKLTYLANWEIKFIDQHQEKIEIPDTLLEAVFNILNMAFLKAEGFLQDLNVGYFKIATCYPERDVDGESIDRDETFPWFVELFLRLVKLKPSVALAYALIWPPKSQFYFIKLKLFALNQTEHFDAHDAAKFLINLDQSEFWKSENRREILFLIHDKWNEFSRAERSALGDRLLDGPDKMRHWTHEEYPKIRDQQACSYAKWLVISGKKFSANQMKKLNLMISKIPEWNDGWGKSVVNLSHGSSGWVGVDDSPDAIIGLPDGEVVKKVQETQGRDIFDLTERRPFTGLVKKNPRKALAALSHSARRGDYPVMLWGTLISEWPEVENPRLYNVFIKRLASLPNHIIYEIRYTLGHWIETNLVKIFQFNRDISWKIFDRFISILKSSEENFSEKKENIIHVDREHPQNQRNTIDYAINGPVGNAADGLINLINSLGLGKKSEIPEEFKSRIEGLLIGSGESTSHAVSILTRQLSWLYYLDPKWVERRIMPWFNFEDPMSLPAWSGYLAAARFLPTKMGAKLKPLLIELFPRIYDWNWDKQLSTVATQMIVELAIHRSSKPDGLTHKEARKCLRHMDDENRQQAIARLGLIGQRSKDNWKKRVIPFINEVWPREREIRTSKMVLSWVSLLDDTGKNFPLVLTVVRRFLAPVDPEKLWLYNFGRSSDGTQSLTRIFPESVLELLDAVVTNNNLGRVPYELAGILSIIEESNSSLTRDRRFLRLIDLVEQT